MGTRTAGLTPGELQRVDKQQPLDLSNPLLDGVQGFWLPLPSTAGGTRLYDITGNSHHGDIEGPQWTHDPAVLHPGLQFDKSVGSDKVVLPTAQSMGLFDKTSVFIYARPTATSGFNNTLLDLAKGEFTEGLRIFWMESEKFRLQYPAPGSFTTQTLPVGELHSVGFTGSPSGGQAYGDGIAGDSVSEPFVTYDDPNFGFEFPTLGLQVDDSNPYGGSILAVVIANTAWPDAKHKAWHQEAVRGFPTLLNTRPNLFGLAGTSGGGAVALNASFSGAKGSLGTDVAVRVALENTLSGASGTLNATTKALPSITSALQGSKGTLASGLASIAAVEATMTGNSGALTSQAAVLAALNAGLTGRSGDLQLQLSTSDFTSINASLPGAKGSLASQLTAQVALDAALSGSGGTLNSQLAVPLSLNATFAGAAGSADIQVGNAQGIVANFTGRQGTMSATLQALQRLQAQLQGAAGTMPVVTEVTAAINASMQGNPGQLAGIIGDIGRLAEIDAQLRDVMTIDATLKDLFTINADLTD